MSARAASVLTVEDDPITRADLRLVLEDAGYEVVADARDGVEAIELAREHRPDVIVLDLALPRLDGIQATQSILAECSIPIVALTGASQAVVEEALDAGASSYVRKPFAGEQVLEAVGLAMSRHRERGLDALRAESLSSLEHLVLNLGYSAELAVELEEQAWDRGHVWRRVQPPNDPTD